MKILTALIGLAVVTSLLSTSASAQVRTNLAIAPGVAAGSSDTGAAVTGAIAFDLSDRATVEGTVGMAGRGPGADGMYAGGALLLHLLPSARAVPYVAVGGGVYHAQFDLNHQRFFGGMGSTYAPGTIMTPLGPGGHGFGMMGGSTTPATGTFYPGQMPAFYAQRMGTLSVPVNNTWGMRGFTDPALSIGGGITVAVTDHVFLRPDARALLVFGNGDRYSIGILTMGVGYRF